MEAIKIIERYQELRKKLDNKTITKEEVEEYEYLNDYIHDKADDYGEREEGEL